MPEDINALHESYGWQSISLQGRYMHIMMLAIFFLGLESTAAALPAADVEVSSAPEFALFIQF